MNSCFSLEITTNHMVTIWGSWQSLQWRHNEHNGKLNHRRLDGLHNRFRRRSKKAKLRVTGLCEGNSPVTGEFPSQRVSNAENVSIWWRHREPVWSGFNVLQRSTDVHAIVLQMPHMETVVTHAMGQTYWKQYSLKTIEVRHALSKVWDEITYPFPNLKNVTVELSLGIDK